MGSGEVILGPQQLHPHFSFHRHRGTGGDAGPADAHPPPKLGDCGVAASMAASAEPF